MNCHRQSRRSHTVTLGCALIVALGVAPSAPGFAANTVLDNRGDTTFFAETPRLLANFPTLESLVPMPLNINPFNRKRVQQSCAVQVYKRTSPVKGAKGTFSGKLVVMDNSKATFKTVDLASGKFRTDADGNATFEYDIATKLFAEGFKSGSISAWSYARIDFAKRKGSWALLRCGVTARK